MLSATFLRHLWRSWDPVAAFQWQPRCSTSSIPDRLVVEMLGGTLADDAVPEVRAQLAANLMLHVRTQGIRNLDPLREIQSELARLDFERSLVRILDAILWLAHPAAGNTGAKRVLACRMEGVAPPTQGS